MAKEESLGINAKKDENFSEWFTQVCSERGAQLSDVRYGVQGFIVHRPWGFRILRKIYEMLEEKIEADGHEPFLFPTVIPEKNLLREKEHAGFAPEVFWITERGNEKMEERVALRPTGETAIYPMYSLWLRSYNDLPFKGYQSRITVFRNEKTTRPFLRGREFMFLETHNVYRTHEEALKQVEVDMGIMEEVIYKELKIPFLFLKRPQFDKFKGAVDTFCADTIMPDGKRNQLSSTHDLGQNFAKAFNVTFTDEDGSSKYAYQTCFGPGIWRIMAALISIHGDDNGLILPFKVAPLQIVIVPILFSKNPEAAEKVVKFCNLLEAEVKKLGYSVKFDNSSTSPGEKYNKWELFGVPLRIEVGPREVDEGKLTFVKRTLKERKQVLKSELKSFIKQMAKELDKEIKSKADAYFKDNTKEASSKEEVISILKTHKGFVKIPFCSVGMDGKSCAEALQAETDGANVCGTIFGKEEKPKKGAKCPICGKEAKHLVYVAKSY